MNTYLNRPPSEKLFSLLQRRGAPFFNTCFDKGQVKNLVSWFLQTYGEKQTIDFLESLKYLGFHQATLAGISLGIEDLEIPPDKPVLISEAHVATHQMDQQNAAGSLTSVEKSQFLIDTWNQTSDLLRLSAVQNFRNRNNVNPVYMMAFSGARGNVSQVRQLVAMRGLMADPQGAILEFPIQSNFREGLTITEYLISCYGARKGLVDTALRTATSGYLTRRLVDSAQHAVVSMIDCGTQRGILLQGHSLEKRVLGRVLAEPLKNKQHPQFPRNFVISSDAAKIIKLFHTQVIIRSPLTCAAATSICQLCYGWNLASGKLVHIGEAIGVIAAQSIGEPGTQLTMRTFHTGGVGVLSDQALKQLNAPYAGTIIFSEPLPGRFIRTPHGKIAYMVKYSNHDPNRILFKIKPFDVVQREFTVREEEFPSGSLLFVKHGEVVIVHQLIAQASHVQLTKQTLPESSHPVYSPLDGQVFFESMPLSVRKEVLTPTEKTKKNSEKEEKPRIELPEVRTMSKIGSFWVFSGHNQHEIHKSRCFLEPGDLISSQSILFDYHFYSSEQAQLKKIGLKVGFGVPVFQIPIHNVEFVKCTYKIQLKKNSIEKLLYQPHQENDPFFLWYPSFHLNSPATNSKNYSSTKNDPRLSNKKVNLSNLVYTHYSALYLQLPFSLLSEGISEQVNEFDAKIPMANVTKGNLFFLQANTLGVELALPDDCLRKTKQGKWASSKLFSSEIKNQSFFSNFLKFDGTINPELVSHFVLKSIKKTHSYLFSKLDKKQLKQTRSWFYIPQSKTLLDFEFLGSINEVSSSIGRQFLPTGSSIEDVCFPKQHILFDVIPHKKLHRQKIKRFSLRKIDKKWYTNETMINQITSHNLINYSSIKKNLISQTFAARYELEGDGHYQVNLLKTNSSGLIWYTREKLQLHTDKYIETSRFFSLKQNFHKYTIISKGFEFHLANEYSILETNVLQKKWSSYIGKLNFINTTNPLSTKQIKTKFQQYPKAKTRFHLDLPTQSGWNSRENLIRIRCTILKDSSYPKFDTKFQTLSSSLDRGLNVFLYRLGGLKNVTKLSLQTYSNNWIISSYPFTTGCVKAQTSGEFRYKDKKTTGTFTNTLRHQDLLTLNLLQVQSSNNLSVGKVIRWGDFISLGVASAHNGQILKRTATNLTLRVGIPVLASARGIVHVSNKELITKNQILMTLKSRRLQTEDIVQGIPKIEQLFEARESQGGQVLQDTVHNRLRNAFVRELERPTSQFVGTEYKSSEQRAIAVETSFLEAQHFLVENIVGAYSNQGVKISEKHVEVIVRQMTSRVRVLEGGETGLLPGELVQHRWIQQFNRHIRDIGLSEATYEPIVLGISKSVLQSDSFLLAASFQEVSRVLVRSALSKKRDFLRGLHENVIVGQLIPAGTGLVPPSSVIPLLNTSYDSNSFLP